MKELIIVLIVTALGWLIYEVKTAPLIEDEVDEILEHLYGKDEK